MSHSIYKTSIWSLLSFFHFIIFTSAISNTPVLRCTLNYFKIDKGQLDEWLGKFRELGKGGQKGVYFYFDCVKMTFNRSENTNFSKLSVIGIAGLLGESGPAAAQVDSDPEGRRQRLQKKFETFVEGFADKSSASSVFSIIVQCVDARLFRELDLSFTFKSQKRGGRLIRFSVVDYITALLTLEAPVTKPLKAFHLYLKQFCHIPRLFAVNKNF